MTPILNTKSTSSAFQLKGGIYTLTTLELHTSNHAALAQQLSGMVSKAPHFFQQTPVVLALDQLPQEEQTLNINQIRHLLHEAGMILVAIRGGSEAHKKDAAIAGIGWLPTQKNKPQNSSQDNAQNNNVVMMKQSNVQPEEPNKEENIAPAESRIIRRPVRSGQQIYSPGDLIVLAPVSAGAELLAAGHIHAYGPLRGRALAGVNGNKDACVFCNHFEAELISISGQYKLTNKIDKTTWGEQWGKSAVISLTNGHLHIAALS